MDNALNSPWFVPALSTFGTVIVALVSAWLQRRANIANEKKTEADAAILLSEQAMKNAGQVIVWKAEEAAKLAALLKLSEDTFNLKLATIQSELSEVQSQLATVLDENKALHAENVTLKADLATERKRRKEDNEKQTAAYAELEQKYHILEVRLAAMEERSSGSKDGSSI